MVICMRGVDPRRLKKKFPTYEFQLPIAWVHNSGDLGNLIFTPTKHPHRKSTLIMQISAGARSGVPWNNVCHVERFFPPSISETTIFMLVGDVIFVSIKFSNGILIWDLVLLALRSPLVGGCGFWIRVRGVMLWTALKHDFRVRRWWQRLANLLLFRNWNSCLFRWLWIVSSWKVYREEIFVIFDLFYHDPVSWT